MSDCNHNWIMLSERPLVYDTKEELWREAKNGAEAMGAFLSDTIVATAYTVICPNCETTKEFVPRGSGDTSAHSREGEEDSNNGM